MIKRKIKYNTIDEIKELNKLAYYTPKIKKVCLILGVTLIFICTITPATNWLIPIIIKRVIYR